MIKVSSFIAAALLALAVSAALGASEPQPSAPAPDFKEVYSLVRAHLPGVNDADLNRLAVDSFIAALRPKVLLVSSNAAAGDVPALSKAMLLEGPTAYLRVAKADANLPQAVREACRMLAVTNKLEGVVLDLRYAGGDDYAAAAATVDLFQKQSRKLFDWGAGMVSSNDKTNALDLPVTILVNHETSGAPEALAAALRQTGTGLIVGSSTAGQALLAEEYPLENGQRLRIATSPVRLGDGSELTSVKPDITVDVSPQDERAYYADGLKPLGQLAASGRASSGSVAGSTNRVHHPRFNEAELVRERKEGFAADLDATTEPASDEPPVIRDPALARAVDVLKGLAVVRAARGS